MEVPAVCIDGYWPLYTTEAYAQSISPTSSTHSHEFHGTVYYMPAGLAGNQHSGACPLTEAPTTEAPTTEAPALCIETKINMEIRSKPSD